MTEENVLKNYRIKKQLDYEGREKFIPQHRYFGLLWWSITSYRWGEYNYEAARDLIVHHYRRNKENKVEYLEVQMPDCEVAQGHRRKDLDVV